MGEITKKSLWIEKYYGRLQSVRMRERSSDKQGRQEVRRLEKEMVTVADSPIGSSPG